MFGSLSLVDLSSILMLPSTGECELDVLVAEVGYVLACFVPFLIAMQEFEAT